MPYAYCIFAYLKTGGSAKVAVPAIDLRLMALMYFVLFTTASYILFITKKEKG